MRPAAGIRPRVSAAAAADRPASRPALPARSSSSLARFPEWLGEPAAIHAAAEPFQKVSPRGCPGRQAILSGVSPVAGSRLASHLRVLVRFV